VVASWKPGDRLLLNGKMLTGRDAAHKRMTDMLSRGEQLPVSFKNRVIYYVGPVDPVRDEVVGPAGPTTATRMDKFTEQMLAETGLIAMVGKAERGPIAIEAIRKHKAAYLMAVGGAAYLVSKAIKGSRVLAFEDLGMEAIYEFDVRDMPVTVAVDSTGESVHHSAPLVWREKIAREKLLEPAE
ncbi:MAG: fumarate hydratase C-terminal domain-containing protein, partial [Sphingomonadaceae bacterium]|nr:fumarate hydratase C-terminal domain-containing protein [Sphingomonadaceae bacterium]